MLADKDRIFTNIYGWDLQLKAAQARGDWDNTKDIIAKGRDWIIDEMKSQVCVVVAERASRLVPNGHLCRRHPMVVLTISLLMLTNLNLAHVKTVTFYVMNHINYWKVH